MADNLADKKHSLPNKEALDYLANKGLKPAFSYEDVWLKEHNTAFTVAKVLELDLLKSIQDSLTSAIEDGVLYKDWEKGITNTMVKHGWWGRKKMTDPETGKEETVQLGCPRRLKIIFSVNLGQAYQRGVWERGEKSSIHNYVLYSVGPSKEHRPEHLAWDGLVLPKDDIFWKTHNPRNGYGCKCTSSFVSEARLKKMKKDGITDMTSMVNGRPTRTKPIKTTPPEMKRQTYVNKRTGKTIEGYEGIDPGFEHNPGTDDNMDKIYKDKLKEFDGK